MILKFIIGCLCVPAAIFVLFLIVCGVLATMMLVDTYGLIGFLPIVLLSMIISGVVFSLVVS